MDRLNSAASNKISQILISYTDALVQDIAMNYGFQVHDIWKSLDIVSVVKETSGDEHSSFDKTKEDDDDNDIVDSKGLLVERFKKEYDNIVKQCRCSWFTKRGEPCNKEKKPGYQFCSVHTEYFELHMEEISKAKKQPKDINVTRKGLHKGTTCTSIW